MDLRDALRLTFASLRAHKMRSLLAAIGVMLGVAAVIGIVTLGAGFQQVITGAIGSQVDSTSIIVGAQPKGGDRGGPPQGLGGATSGIFTDRDVDALVALAHVKNATATSTLAAAEVRLDGKLLPGIVVSAARGERTVALEAGREVRAEREATVSNQTAARFAKAANASSALGLVVNVTTVGASGRASTSVTIVGVEKAGAFAFGPGESLTGGAALVQATPVDGVPTRLWTGLTLHATDAGSVGEAKSETKAYLEGASDARARLGDNQQFSYATQEDIAKQITTSITQFTVFLGAIGAIALLVGLVGIANIMLVSVSERTREIGVMKAIGAKKSEILLLFLLDAVAICVVGAALGVGLGTLMGVGLGAVVTMASGGNARVPFVFLGDWYALAIALGVGVGVVAGLYPAWKAAKVSPVEALRYE